MRESLQGVFFVVCRGCKEAEWCIFGACRSCKWRKRGLFCRFTGCKPPARVLFDCFTGCKLLARVLFHSLHELQTPSEGPFLLFARAANLLRGSFSTLCTSCKPPARVLFHSLHGLQALCEGAFFKRGGSCNSESRRKSDFSLFLPLQKRVEILVLFFRMRMFYLRCLWRCECCYWGCLRCIAFFFLRSLLSLRLLIHGRVLTGRNLPGRATLPFLITLKSFGGTGTLTILLGRGELFLWRDNWRERYFCVKIWMNASFLGGSLVWSCGRSFPKEKNSTLLEILFT